MVEATECAYCPIGKYCTDGIVQGDCDAGFYCDYGAAQPNQGATTATAWSVESLALQILLVIDVRMFQRSYAFKNAFTEDALSQVLDDVKGVVDGTSIGFDVEIGALVYYDLPLCEALYQAGNLTAD
jgi:hypothetical protein